MARAFDGTNDFAHNDTPPTVVTDNFTMALMLNLTNIVDSDIVFHVGTHTSGNGYGFYCSGANMGIIISGAAIRDFAAPIANTWEHWALTRSSGTWQGYKNGAAAGSTWTDVPVTPTSGTSGGVNMGGPPAQPSERAQKLQAECAIWERVLTAAEIAALGDGYTPIHFRPSLVFYTPMIGRASPELDLIGGKSLTLTGTTAGAHPRVILPKRRRLAA